MSLILLCFIGAWGDFVPQGSMKMDYKVVFARDVSGLT